MQLSKKKKKKEKKKEIKESKVRKRGWFKREKDKREME